MRKILLIILAVFMTAEWAGYAQGFSQSRDLSVLFLGTGAADWKGKDDRGEHRRLTSMLADREVLFDLTAGNLEMIPSGCTPETIFYTHSHGDHYSPSAALKAGVRTVYLSYTWYDKARSEFREAAKKAGVEMPEIIPLHVGRAVQVGDLKVTPLPANHLASSLSEQSLIYLIEKNGARVLYATDTAGIPAEAARLAGIDSHDRSAKPITGIIMEATMGLDHHNDYRLFAHSSVADVERVALALENRGRYRPVGNQPVYLTHMARTLHGTQAELDTTLPKPLKAAYDGLEVIFPAEPPLPGPNMIPAPVKLTVSSGSVSSKELAALPEKVKISKKSLLTHLKGQDLTDWQLESAYRIEISPEAVKIEAADEQGVFYARQTLKMLTSLNETVACCTVLDWPRFRHRGVMLDESRHFQGKEFVLKQLEMMALLKMNRFHFHLVDNPGWRLQIDAYPLLTQLTAWRPEAYFWDWQGNSAGGGFVKEGTPGAYGGYYTKQDIAEILEFAAERHIEVIPEIEMPGHNYEARAAYPELACSLEDGGSQKCELCPGKETAYKFLENVLLEVFELFPSEYIHIGGDEAKKDNWKICPDCQARMKAEGMEDVTELQSYMIRRMERFANEHGKRIIGWDEILEGGLAPDATVMSWRGTEGGIKAIAEGHDVIFTPTEYCYFDYMQDPGQYKAVGPYLPLEKVYAFDPMVKGVSKEDAHHILGLQGNLWTEFVLEDWHAELQLYPRVFAIAELGWTPAENKNWQDFKCRASALSTAAQQWGYTVYKPTIE